MKKSHITRVKSRVSSMIRPRVFIGSSTEGRPIAQAIGEGLSEKFAVTTWWEIGTFPGRMPPFEVLQDELDRRDFAVLIASEDDALLRRGELKSAMRDNVLFEYGLFVGRHGAIRTQLVVPDSPRFHIPSDLAPSLRYAGKENQLSTEDQKRLVASLSSVINEVWNAVEPNEVELARARARRLYRFLSWSRDRLASPADQYLDDLDVVERTIQVLELSSFIGEDVERLGMRRQFDELVAALEGAAESFPQTAITRPTEDEIMDRVARGGPRVCSVCDSHPGQIRDRYPDHVRKFLEEHALHHLLCHCVKHLSTYERELLETYTTQDFRHHDPDHFAILPCGTHAFIYGIGAGAGAVGEAFEERKQTLWRWAEDNRGAVVAAFEHFEGALLDRTLVHPA